jgi:hypothetical protein
MALNGVWIITRNSAIKGIIKGVCCITKKNVGVTFVYAHTKRYFLLQCEYYKMILARCDLGFSVTGILASATGGLPISICNVAIFLVKLVTCTSYGATLWDSVVGYGVFPRRFYSDCTDQFLFCQQNNYFLDVNSLSHYY